MIEATSPFDGCKSSWSNVMLNKSNRRLENLEGAQKAINTRMGGWGTEFKGMKKEVRRRQIDEGELADSRTTKSVNKLTRI